MKHPPEIIAARINFEAAVLNAEITGTRISDENDVYHKDGLRCSPSQYWEIAEQATKRVAAILAELEGGEG